MGKKGTGCFSHPHGLRACYAGVRDSRGQAFIEFLIVFPPLFLVFMAVVFFGKGYVTKARVDAAVRYAAWKQGRTGEAVDEKRLSEIFFPREGKTLKVFDPGPPSIAGIEWLRGINHVIDRLGRTEENGVQVFLEAPYFFPSSIGISAPHYVDMKAWDDRTVLAASGLWGLAIVKGLSSAKTTGLCGGGGVKMVVQLFAKDYMEKKADAIVDDALKSGIEELKGAVTAKVEGWMGEIGGAFEKED